MIHCLKSDRCKAQAIQVFICLFLAITSHKPAVAQDFDHWHLVKNLNVVNGLPQNTIRAMSFDNSTGFLWLATDGGLIRYDGVDVKNFTIQNLPQMQTSRIYGLYPTTDHRLLAVERTGSVLDISGDEAVVIPGLKMDWVNIKDQLIRNFHSIAGERHNTTLKIADSTPDFISLFWVNDTLCLTNSTTHIYLFNRGKKTQEWKKNKPQGTAFILQGKDIYALNEDGSIYEIDIRQDRLKKIITKQSIFGSKNIQLFQFVGQIPLLFSQNKVYRLNFSGDSAEAIFLADLTDCPERIISMLYDSVNEQLFCGTINNGLYIYKKSPFYTYEITKAHGDLSHNSETDLNNLYACVLIGDSELISTTSQLNLNTNAFQVLKPTFYYSTLATDGKHIFGWVGQTAAGALIRFTLPNLDHPKTFPAQRNIRGLYTDSRNRVWFSGDYYLSRLQGDSVIRYLDTASYKKPFSTGFEYLVETPGKGLVGANGYGVCLIDTNARTCRTLFSQDKYIIRSPYVDQDGLCWIATYGDGIYMYDLNEKKLYKPSISNIKELAYSHCFIDDKEGNFFISTNNGLFRINRQGLIAACKDPKTPLIYQYFDASNSLKANEFNGGCSPPYNRMTGGDILLPSLNGLVRVSPALLARSETYPLFVQSVASSDSVYPYAASLNFKSNERYLTFDVSFGQWDYTNFSGIYYRLDGTTQWTYLPPGNRKIALTDLSGGNHQLEIKKQFDLAGEKVSTVTVDFAIGLKLYERKAIWFLTVLFLLGFIWLIAYLINLRLAIKNVRLAENIREKTAEVMAKNIDLEDALSKLNNAFEQMEKQGHFQRRLIALISHDIMIPLRYISKVSNQLLNYNEKLSKRSSTEAMGEINTTSIGLVYLGENIIQWIRLQEDSYEVRASRFNLNTLVDELLVLHQHLAEEKGNRIEKEMPEAMSCFHDPVIVRVILHNLLLNANKFTSEGVVSIRIYWQDLDICMIISDTGTGIPLEKLNRLNNWEPVNSKTGTNEEPGWGLGYRLIMDMLRLCDGKIHIASRIQEGTSVTIVLPPLNVNA